eukprot:scaffold374_cov124-Cylindrotheca_fusiformis.AAC.1
MHHQISVTNAKCGVDGRFEQVLSSKERESLDQHVGGTSPAVVVRNRISVDVSCDIERTKQNECFAKDAQARNYWGLQLTPT